MYCRILGRTYSLVSSMYGTAVIYLAKIPPVHDPELEFYNSLWGLGIGIVLSYRPARLPRLAELIPGLLNSLKIPAPRAPANPPPQEKNL